MWNGCSAVVDTLKRKGCMISTVDILMKEGSRYGHFFYYMGFLLFNLLDMPGDSVLYYLWKIGSMVIMLYH